MQKRTDYSDILNKSVKTTFREKLHLEQDNTYLPHSGSWDTDDAIDKTKLPEEGSSPNSPGWTIFKRNTKPQVQK
jgi:hypothetical protein